MVFSVQTTNIMDLLQREDPQILAGIGVRYRKIDSRCARSAISLKQQLKSESYINCLYKVAYGLSIGAEIYGLE